MSEAPAVELTNVEAVPLAVRDGLATRADLAAVIGELLGDVWAYIRERGDLDPRHSVVVYRGDPGKGPAPIEVGVQVGHRFDEASPSGVHSSELPAGRVARAVHHGPYDQMAPTYQAIAAWAEETGSDFGGASWEIYGDWHEDPAKLEVEICFLIA